MGNDPRSWKPDLGGWLTMLNCAGWLALVYWNESKTSPSDSEQLWPLAAVVVLGYPFAWLFLFPPVGVAVPTTAAILEMGLIVGVNSFAWGYGMAATLRWLFHKQNTAVKPIKPFSS